MLFFFLGFFYLMCVRFVLYYYRAQLRRKRKIIITMRCWRILKTRVSMNTLPLSIPPPGDKVEFSGEMKGIIRNRLLFQWDGGLGSFFMFCLSVRG